MNARAKSLLERFESFLRGSDSNLALNETSPNWLFGLPHATALDAHLIVFIARMYDVGRSDIIPESLKTYAAQAMQQIEWKTVMQGRKTMVG